MKAYCLNNISKVALATLAGNNTTVDTVEAADSILVRSYQMADYELPQDVVAVARAGAGVNNIPLDKYADKGVVVFNTPGANANAVKELVLCGLFMASRDLIGGVKYINENKEEVLIEFDFTEEDFNNIIDYMKARKMPLVYEIFECVLFEYVKGNITKNVINEMKNSSLNRKKC